jgi:Protein similar to CwfJ C-terminus 1/Protein similar to CwfJ C-terminus 2
MLSGIKVGKKKIKINESNLAQPSSSNQSVAESIRSQLTTSTGNVNLPPPLNGKEYNNKRKAASKSHNQEAEAQSIHDMVRAEKSDRRSMDDVYAQTILRMKSRYPTMNMNNKSHGDDDDNANDDIVTLTTKKITEYHNHGGDSLWTSKIPTNIPSLASKCWWWIESPSFSKHMLLALGDHMSMLMAPAHQSLVPGNCIYLVPIAPTDALVRCDDDVWREINTFQSLLRRLYDDENQDVIFTETVLPTKGKVVKNFWQTRLVAVPIPRQQNADTPIFFRQALLDQTQEDWVTNSSHSKLLSTKGKPRGLRSIIPIHFPYFHVEWEPQNGYVQILEANDFSPDFAMDTLAGMLGMEPIRFRRRHASNHRSSCIQEEQQMVKIFLEKWNIVNSEKGIIQSSQQL